jgi:hypothetical protein
LTYYEDLLRVIRKGPAVKNAVDEAIDQCGLVFNLRDSIEEARASAEQTTDQQSRRMFVQKGDTRVSLLYTIVLIGISVQGYSTSEDTLALLFSRRIYNPPNLIQCHHLRV